MANTRQHVPKYAFRMLPRLLFACQCFQPVSQQSAKFVAPSLALALQADQGKRAVLFLSVFTSKLDLICQHCARGIMEHHYFVLESTTVNSTNLVKGNVSASRQSGLQQWISSIHGQPLARTMGFVWRSTSEWPAALLVSN